MIVVLNRAAVIWIVAFVSSMQTAQVPPRDPDPRAVRTHHGTAVIRGRVLDAETGQAVSRIPVMLAGEDLPPDTVVMSDHEGRFEFANLRAGWYSLAAETSPSRPGYLEAAYRDPADRTQTGRRPGRILVKDGEAREDIHLLVRRARVIAGRVFDEAGDPIADVQVRAELLDGRSGGFSRGAETNDLGAFRLFGLTAGRYRVCAFPHPHSLPRGAAITSGIVRTCYPSTPVEADSTPIDVAAGDSEIEIRLQRHRLFTISGMVLDPSGGPADRVNVELMQYEKNGSSSRSVDVEGSTFTAHGVAPGSYGIVARRGSVYDSDDTRERLVGFVPLRIDTADVENVVVPLVRPATLKGHVIAEDGSLPPVKGRAVRVWPDEETTRIQEGLLTPAVIRDDFTFELRELFGRYTVHIEPPPAGWIVKSIRYRGEEIIELPTEFQSGTDPRELRIVLSNRPATLVARVLDERGVPTSDVVVMLIRTDKRFWSGPTHVRIAYPERGVYEYPNLPPGEFYVAALAPEDVPPPNDHERLEAVAALAQKMTFLESDRRVVDLQVVRPPAR